MPIREDREVLHLCTGAALIVDGEGPVIRGLQLPAGGVGFVAKGFSPGKG